jgi:serine/threonine protein kinase/tetratricopeptide (TPR) repeat protein
MSLAPGARLGAYQLVAAIGAGGMGEVYRATDTKLGRDVALKVLPAEMASSPERLKRFRREAKALAALDHPGVVTVYSVEEAGGVHFLTMQLVEGQPLDRLIPEGGLPLEKLVEIASALADALAAAHEKGIVHRDLKPANVMITKDGRVKVLDFGLAKMAAPLAGEGSGSELPTDVQTREGVVVGTLPYMSPEQLSGRALDHRTDVFSLGVLLYEMATGRRPFEGRSSAEVVSAILRDTPRPLRQRRFGLPEKLERIVERRLAKDARDRPASARDVRDELEALRREVDSGAAPTSSRDVPAPVARRAPSIAVLPFSDMSPARDHDWFCEGIAEEILNALTKLPDPRVATRTSAFRFKDPARDIARIGETLGVTTLLEGSVRTAGSRLRVTAQLVNASDGYQLWSERFDRQMEDVFEIQDEIAKNVVEALELRLVAPSGPLGEARHSNDLEAYHLFLRGRHFRYTKLDLTSARGCFGQAIERDPAYALARIALAETLVVLLIYGMIPSPAGQARAKEELRRAHELAGESAQARGVAALLSLVCDWDTRTALDGFERSLELDPTSIPVRAWYTWALLGSGGLSQAVEQASRIVQQDPHSPYAHAMAGLTHLMAGRVEEALRLERRAVEIEPQSLQATYMLGLALAATSAWEEANEWFGRAFDRSSRAPFFLGLVAWGQAASGRRDEARRTLSELERRAATEYVSPLFLTWASSELGDPETARRLLAEAFAERASLLVLPELPCFRKLRSEPLMKELAQRLLEAAGSDASR